MAFTLNSIEDATLSKIFQYALKVLVFVYIVTKFDAKNNNKKNYFYD